MAQTLFAKVWDQHAVRRLPNGQTQLYIGLHLIHEVTTPQAFDELKMRGWSVAAPDRTFATLDHIVPTGLQARPFGDEMAEAMTTALERNCREHGIRIFDLASGDQGIVHVIGPELGLTQPGMTICCGDSHTSTHGAFGAIAFGIGTSQVRDVLASQTLAISPFKVRRIEVNGQLGPGVFAKDVILTIIGRLGVHGGAGFAYEYAGDVLDRMTMDERMTICNMSIEGGARLGYVNPDETTFDYLRGRRFAPAGQAFDRACTWWRAMASDSDAAYDDRVVFDASAIGPTVTWGINPGQSVSVDGRLPDSRESAGVAEALEFMGLAGGQPIAGTKVDVAFVGSCTNGRLSDLREAARIARGQRVAPHVRALVVPGSQAVRLAAEREGLHDVFTAAGFEWRAAGCSMCLAMNPDRLNGRELCASSSNRNFKGRQGSPTGRTLLMSPAMVAAAAVAGEVVDVRTWGGVMKILSVSGPALSLPADDIDTDRIMPARFLKAVTFEGLEAHLFRDDRHEANSRGLTHPFDDPAATDAQVLLVGRNFGCGSSREHAPQAIRRRGIRIVVGESFAEIFFGNAVMIGLACVTVSRSDLDVLHAAVAADPTLTVQVDLVARTVTAGAISATASLPESARHALTSGEWDATATLLADYDAVRRTARALPYISGF